MIRKILNLGKTSGYRNYLKGMSNNKPCAYKCAQVYKTEGDALSSQCIVNRKILQEGGDSSHFPEYKIFKEGTRKSVIKKIMSVKKIISADSI